MASIGVRLELLKTKQRKDGNCPVFLTLTKQRRRIRVSTGIAVPASAWNANKQLIRKGHEAKIHNKQLADLKAKTYATIQELEEKTGIVEPEEVKEALTETQVAYDFFDYANAYLESIKANHSGTYSTKSGSLRKFQSFRKNKATFFHSITPTMLRHFVSYLKTEHQNNATTIQKNLSHLDMIFKLAIREGQTDKANPFEQVKIKREPVRKAKLTLEELESLEALELKPNSLEWNVKNAFLFCFYSAGMRIGDLLRLRWESITESRLEYRMNKTKQYVSFQLPAQAQSILSHYNTPKKPQKALVFPFMVKAEGLATEAHYEQIRAKTALINKYLKKLAIKAGIEKNLSSHIARHSFADLARKKDIPVYTISKMLGHSSLAITENYLSSMDKEAVDTGMADMFGQGK